MIPGLRVIELILEIVLEAMKGQPPEIKAELWRYYAADVRWWRKVLGIDKLAESANAGPAPEPPSLP